MKKRDGPALKKEWHGADRKTFAPGLLWRKKRDQSKGGRKKKKQN